MALTLEPLSSLMAHSPRPTAALITDAPGGFSLRDDSNSAQPLCGWTESSGRVVSALHFKLTEERSHRADASVNKAQNDAPIPHPSAVILLVSTRVSLVCLGISFRLCKWKKLSCSVVSNTVSWPRNPLFKKSVVWCINLPGPLLQGTAEWVASSTKLMLWRQEVGGHGVRRAASFQGWEGGPAPGFPRTSVVCQ